MVVVFDISDYFVAFYGLAARGRLDHTESDVVFGNVINLFFVDIEFVCFLVVACEKRENTFRMLLEYTFGDTCEIDFFASYVDEKFVAFVVVEECFQSVYIFVGKFLPEKRQYPVYFLGSLFL